MATFQPVLATTPDSSLAITNSLGSIINLIEQPVASEHLEHKLIYDADGYSVALRMVWYTLKLTKATEIFRFATSKQKNTLLKHVLLFFNLASDNVSVPGSRSLWNQSDPDLGSEILTMLNECSELYTLWLEQSGMIMANQLLEQSRGLSVTSYYSARAYGIVAMHLEEQNGQTTKSSEAEKLKRFRKSQEIFADTAFLEFASDRKALLRLCNELISDLTGRDFQGNLAEGT